MSPETVRLCGFGSLTRAEARGAALTGLDQPIKQETDVRVQVPAPARSTVLPRGDRPVREDIAVKALPSAGDSSSVPDSVTLNVVSWPVWLRPPLVEYTRF